jgi:hypothetical protein
LRAKVLRQQGLQPCAGRRQLRGVLQLHHDGGDLGRLRAVEQALGLPQVHGQVHVVNRLDAQVHGLDGLQAGHVGGTLGGGHQHFDAGGRALGIWAAFQGRERGHIVGHGDGFGRLHCCRSAGVGVGVSAGIGAVGHLQRCAQLQLARHAGADDGGMGAVPSSARGWA